MTKEKTVEESPAKVEETTKNPSWIKMKPKEVESLIVELAKKGESPAKIGLILRDKHGIPKTRVFGKKMKQILAENNIETKSELAENEDKINKLKGHIQKNKHDYSASRSLTKKLWTKYRLERQN